MELFGHDPTVTTFNQHRQTSETNAMCYRIAEYLHVAATIARDMCVHWWSAFADIQPDCTLVGIP